MDEQPSGVAPPVVAVVVTRDPGPWLEEALAALGSQDYPSLSILVVDAGSADDLTARVAAAAPGAYVRRVAGESGVAAAANEVLTVVEGASHFMFCHDDVAPDPDAVRQLVEEAFRSNAGVVGPKLVEWDAPERLIGVGLGVDKYAVAVDAVEHGELDQEQFDAVRDVFAVSGACMLVRADLFTSLGGFTPELGGTGHDVELCWRAQIAGARVVVCPAGRVRHMEAGRRGLRATRGADEAVAARNRMRTVLSCYGVVHLVRVLVQTAVLSTGEVAYALITGNLGDARVVVTSWTENLRRWGSIRATRKRVHASRALGDGEVRRLQLRGSARLRHFVRTQIEGDGDGHSVATVGRDLAGSLRQGTLGLPIVVWAAIVAFLFVGSRKLLSGGVPAVGQLPDFPSSAGTFLHLFFSGWRSSGLGQAGAAPPAFGLLGLGGWLLLGATGLLRLLLVLGMIPLGAAGAYRLGRPFGGRAIRLATTVVYVAVPVSYNALAQGRWPGLLLYGAAPFLLRRLLAATGLEPFTSEDEPRTLWEQIVPLGILLAVVTALVPSAPLVVLLVAAAIVVGSLLVGGAGRALRALAAAAGASAVAVVLLVPWSLGVLRPGGEWAVVTGVARPLGQVPTLGEILRFDTGPIGSPLGWGFLVAALVPLLIGREWRLAWAVRLWFVTVACWLVAWAGGRGWLGLPLPAPEVLLAPAAAALALSVALGVVAFVVDLPGYSFGLRQVVSVLAAAAVAAAALPVLVASVGGRWRMPEVDYAHLLDWMPAEQESGAFRVLWIGSPDVLPMDGWRLEPGVAYATSRNGVPDASDLWPARSSGATGLIAQSVDVARRGGTTGLGHLLAPMGIRYLALPRRVAPDAPGPPAPLPADIQAALRGQLDLREVPSDPDLQLYENVAWAPARASLSPEAAEASRNRRPTAAGGVDLTGSAPVLGDVRAPQSFAGPLTAGEYVLVAEAASDRWALRVAGHDVRRSSAFGWATIYTVGADGAGSLRYRTPVTRYLAIVVELALWVIAVRAIVMSRRRRRPRRNGPTSGEEPPSSAVDQPVPEDGEPLPLISTNIPPAEAGQRVSDAPVVPRARRRRVHRLPAIVVLAAILVGAGVVDRRSTPAVAGTSAGRRLDSLMPTAAAPTALSSAWYCPAATAVPGGMADGTIVVVNPTARALDGTLTVVPVQGDPVSTPFTVEAGARWATTERSLVQSPQVAALVEFAGGGAAVEQLVTGPLGASATPCASDASDRWYFATGSTDRDQTLSLFLFNPFPGDAIVDLSFATDQAPSAPPDFQGLVVPARGLRVVDIGEHVRRRVDVATTVTARSGRVVAGQIQVDNTAPVGVVSMLGAPSTGPTWIFPDGVTAAGVTEQFHLFNPSGADAAVTVELALDQGEVEPFELTVPAAGTYVLTASTESRIPKDVGHAVTVRATNGVGVVVQRSVVAVAPAPSTGIFGVLGARHTANQWLFAIGAAGDIYDESVVLFNPGPRPASVAFRLLDGSANPGIDGLQAVAVPAGGRTVVRMVDHVRSDQLGLALRSSVPVVAERVTVNRVNGQGISSVIGIPAS